MYTCNVLAIMYMYYCAIGIYSLYNVVSIGHAHTSVVSLGLETFCLLLFCLDPPSLPSPTPTPTLHYQLSLSHPPFFPPLGIFSCPCYYYPNRSGGSGRPSFVVAVDLRCGSVPPEHWIKRGTALLMSLDN